MASTRRVWGFTRRGIARATAENEEAQGSTSSTRGASKRVLCGHRLCVPAGRAAARMASPSTAAVPEETTDAEEVKGLSPIARGVAEGTNHRRSKVMWGLSFLIARVLFERGRAAIISVVTLRLTVAPGATVEVRMHMGHDSLFIEGVDETTHARWSCQLRFRWGCSP